MPLYRFQISQGADSAFARDRIINNVHLNDHGPGTDPVNLCTDLANLWKTSWFSTALREIRVTCYGVGPAPQLPKASVVLSEGVFPVTAGNREIAICLSYYAVRSNPRRRGRLYLCPALTNQPVSGARPPASLLTKCLDLGAGIAGIGGIDVDWVVYSPTDNQHSAVVGSWCDDAWDVVRSRGLAATTRQERLQGA